jgi:hypothetical protein
MLELACDTSSRILVAKSNCTWIVVDWRYVSFLR